LLGNILWFEKKIRGKRSSEMILPSNTALLVVDVQRAIDDPSWAADGPRNNPGAEANIAALLAS
jgi:hypothetical protein